MVALRIIFFKIFSQKTHMIEELILSPTDATLNCASTNDPEDLGQPGKDVPIIGGGTCHACYGGDCWV